MTSTVYDTDGQVTATIDPLGRVAASDYDDAGLVTAGYQGQIIATSGTFSTGYSSHDGYSHWKFSNLSPSSASGALSYEIYVHSTTVLSGSDLTSFLAAFSECGVLTFNAASDADDTPLGSDWYDLGTVTVALTATKLTVSRLTATTADQVCLLQQTLATTYDDDGNVATTTDARGSTTAYAYDDLGQRTSVTAPDSITGLATGAVTTTVYDDDGDVTATIDPLGRVTASTYDEFGNVAAGYQGQIIESVTGTPGYDGSDPSSWTFSNLSPGSGLSFEVYVQGGDGCSYTVSDAASTILAPAPASDPSDTPLGDGWYDLGTVSVLASTAWVKAGMLATEAPDAVCLLQTSTTAYDADGNLTATIDALDRVTATHYDALGEDVADYQGQVVESVSTDPNYDNSVPSWTFSNLVAQQHVALRGGGLRLLRGSRRG